MKTRLKWWAVVLMAACSLSAHFKTATWAQEEGKVSVIERSRLEGAGFILPAKLSSDKRIFASQEHVQALAEGDMVYVSVGKSSEVLPGSRFTVYGPTRMVIHPVTGESLGYLIAVKGTLEIVEAYEKIASAIITDSYNNPIFKGDLITPFEEKPLLQIDLPQTVPAKDIHGYVVATKDNKEYVGQNDVVYLDRGSRDGVAPGDFFVISRPGDLLEDAGPEAYELPHVRIGKLVVIATKERTATAFITQSSSEIQAGNSVSYLNPPR